MKSLVLIFFLSFLIFLLFLFFFLRCYESMTFFVFFFIYSVLLFISSTMYHPSLFLFLFCFSPALICLIGNVFYCFFQQIAEFVHERLDTGHRRSACLVLLFFFSLLLFSACRAKGGAKVKVGKPSFETRHLAVQYVRLLLLSLWSPATLVELSFAILPNGTRLFSIWPRRRFMMAL